MSRSNTLGDEEREENEYGVCVKDIALSTARALVTIVVGLRNALMDVLDVFDLSSEDEKAAN